MDEQQQDMIAQFSAVTGANPQTAHTTLQSSNWNLEEAVSLYFAAHDDPQEAASDNDDLTADEPSGSVSAQPTTAQPTASSSSRQPPPAQKKKHMTLDDLKKQQEADEDDEDEDDKKQDMFAGGEKSGLAVKNPGQGGSGGPIDHFKNIMNQARQNRERPAAGAGAGGEGGQVQDEEPQQPTSTNFTGRAQTLGGDDAESQVVSDPTAENTPAGGSTQRVARTLHLWADGVSIDDGPLFRFDDPANQNIMAEINRGRAPLALLDVQPDQEVDLSLEPHKNENYVQPKKKWKPFEGGGQRLGSPTPGAGLSVAPTAPTATSSSSQPSQPAQEVQVDDSQPTIQLQIRLADGTRLPSRFNTTHTIGDVYDFVNAASPASLERNYALMTTFPSKELEDRSVVLGDMGEFRRGGVVVQKWK